MLALYLACLGFGLTVLAASLVLGTKDTDHSGHGGPGGHDHDAHTDHGDGDHDAAADHDHGGAVEPKGDLKLGDGWNPFASLRFWTFGLFSFGLVGSLLTAAGLATVLTLGSALLAGALFGWMAASFFRMLNRDTVSGETQLSQLAGEEARVVVPVRPGGTGKIVVERMSGRVELPATTRDPIAIEAGQTVLVASVNDGVADVSRATPSEREQKARQAQAAARTRERGNV